MQISLRSLAPSLGCLARSLYPTQKGFNKVFAAWIIEDDHPFTTGETGGINRLFKHMQSRFQLPTDTTVRNTLAKTYAEMFETLKTELNVSAYSANYKFDLSNTS